MPVAVSVSPWMEAPIRLNGAHEFVVGDVHGMVRQLESLLAAMLQSAPRQATLTFLGDLIDRGLDSLRCLDLATVPAAALGFAKVHHLLGNHEGMMLLGMLDVEVDVRAPAAWRLWKLNGGTAVLGQLGLDGHEPREQAVMRLQEALGERALKALGNAATHRIAGNLLFIHAGVSPEMKLEDWLRHQRRFEIEDEDHYSWIRFPFFGHEGPYPDGLLVVHGHTPEYRVKRWKGTWQESDGLPSLHLLDGWRLGLDGGSYATGVVTGAELRDGKYRIYLAGETQ